MDVKPNIKTRIVNAANALVAQGTDKPTNDQVRQKMGGGSLSHISPVMREWREERRQDLITALDMPDELQKAVQISLSQVWATASQLATANTEQVQIQAKADVLQVTTELSEALTELANLEKQLADITQLSERQFSELGALRHDLGESRTENEKMAITHATLTTGIDDRDRQIQELKAELKESRAENKTMQSELIDIVRGKSKGKR